MSKTISVWYDDFDHVVGDKDCEWCMGELFPMSCRCGGLIHCELDTDEADWDFAIVKCDKCKLRKSITLTETWDKDLKREVADGL